MANTVEPIVVDTNVPMVANKMTPQASPACILTCVRKIRDIQAQKYLLVMDRQHTILREYIRNLQNALPGVGPEFLRWVITNQHNPDLCHQVDITPTGPDEYQEFPQDPDLDNFDRSDRKFVAVALTHADKPPILNASDSDWMIYRDVLAKYGVRIEFLCPELMVGRQP